MGICRKLGQSSKKPKTSVVMDFSQPFTLGFRTRAAKTLALLRLNSHSPTTADSFRYLQLRNRHLERTHLPKPNKQQQYKKSKTQCLKSESGIRRDEIEEFFQFAEEKIQRRFTDKYNFDVVAGVPLSGRYEWVKVLDGLLGKHLRNVGLAFNCTFLLFGYVIQLIACASNIYYRNDNLDKKKWTYIFEDDSNKTKRVAAALARLKVVYEGVPPPYVKRDGYT